MALVALLGLVSVLLLLLLQGCVLVVQGESSSVLGLSTSVSFSADSGPQLAVNDLMAAYLLIQPNVSLSMTKVSLTTALVQTMTSQGQDFALISSELTTTQALAYPNLQMFPILAVAVVPIYRLDGLGTGAPQLILTRPVLAEIFLGNITWWNDPAIQQCNPSQTMPAQRITVILSRAGVPVTRAWTLALGKFYAPFNASIPPTDAPQWPLQSYSRYLVTASVTAQPSAVLSNDGAIGYTYLSVAEQTTVQIAAMVNKGNTIVQASADSVTFAAVELGTAPRSRTTAFMDLTDAVGSSAWPICMMSFLLLDSSFTRSTCHVRAAVVEFWLWFYTSSVAASQLSSRQYAQVPSIVLTQLSVVSELSSHIQCRGAVALPTTTTTTRILAAPVSIAFLATLFANLYQTQDSTVAWQTQQNTDQVILQQYIAGEVDLAFVNPNNVDASLMTAVFSDSATLTMPSFIMGNVIAYNPQITANVSIAAYTLTLDMHTIGLIQWACVLYWNDPLIIAQNPWLGTLLPPLSVQPVMLQLIMGCDATPHQAPIEDAMLAAIAEYATANHDLELQQCISNYSSALWAAFYSCTSVPAYGIVYAPTESTVPSLMTGTIGAFGIVQDSGDSSYGVVTITDTRDGVTVNTSDSFEGMAACALDTFSGVAMYTSGNPLPLSPASHNPKCYRPTQQVMAILRSSYVSSASDATGCERGYDTLKFMQWFIQTSRIDLLVNSVNMLRVTSLSADIYQSELGVLQSVMCDDQTLLETSPVGWTLASGVYAFVVVVAAMGLVTCFALAAFVFKFRQHAMIRSASPLFLLLSLCGLMVMFASGFLLVAPVSAASCSAFSWLVNFGLMLTFAPLFAKTWRIYRIFGRKKLSVVTIPNKKLLVMVGTLLALELLIMAIWQGIGNLQPQILEVQTNSPTASPVAVIAARMQVDEYVQCGVPSGGPRSMFIVVCVEKALLFVWGAMMAFSTRKVSSTFNEAQGITLALYNTIFTIGVIAPIILVIGATGDVLDLLLAFALLWISGFTVATLFGPKVMQVLGKSPDATQGNTSVVASSSSGSGYAFMSLAALSSISVLQGYLAALQKHVQQVEVKLAKMRASAKGSSGLDERRGTMTKGFGTPSEKRVLDSPQQTPTFKPRSWSPQADETGGEEGGRRSVSGLVASTRSGSPLDNEGLLSSTPSQRMPVVPSMRAAVAAAVAVGAVNSASQPFGGVDE